jgi:hypothetical protein
MRTVLRAAKQELWETPDGRVISILLIIALVSIWCTGLVNGIARGVLVLIFFVAGVAATIMAFFRDQMPYNKRG